jgi:hypothetical protein
MFYGIDLKFAPLLTQTNFSFQFWQQVALAAVQEQCSKTISLCKKLESFFNGNTFQSSLSIYL